MPASMISEESGSSPKVIGSSIAMVGIGPMPGSTPISVPSRQPISAKPRFLSDTAAPNPVARFWNRSNPMLATPPGRQRLSQQVDEHGHGENGEGGAEQGRFGEVDLAARIGGEHGEQQRGERQADDVDQHAENQDRGDDHRNRAQLHRL